MHTLGEIGVSISHLFFFFFPPKNGARFFYFYPWNKHKRGLDRNASMEWIRRPTACNASSRRWNSPWNPAVRPWVILEGVFAATATFLAQQNIASTFALVHGLVHAVAT
jgi:hypothetical protein